MLDRKKNRLYTMCIVISIHNNFNQMRQLYQQQQKMVFYEYNIVFNFILLFKYNILEHKLLPHCSRAIKKSIMKTIGGGL